MSDRVTVHIAVTSSIDSSVQQYILIGLRCSRQFSAKLRFSCAFIRLLAQQPKSEVITLVSVSVAFTVFQWALNGAGSCLLTQMLSDWQ